MNMSAETGDLQDTAEEKSGRREAAASDQVSGGQWLRSLRAAVNLCTGEYMSSQDAQGEKNLKKAGVLSGRLSDLQSAVISYRNEPCCFSIVTSISFFVSVLPSEQIISAVSLLVLC